MAVVFLVSAARLYRRGDLVAVLVAGIVAALFGYASAFGSPVFVGDGSLNRGAALFVGILGVLLGVGGVMLTRQLRFLRMLFFVAAGGILLGDIVGWIARSRLPSKYDQPAGRMHRPASPSREGASGAWTDQEVYPTLANARRGK
jgi:hypothetical protein